MFAARYFAARYFAARYWPQAGSTAAAVVTQVGGRRGWGPAPNYAPPRGPYPRVALLHPFEGPEEFGRLLAIQGKPPAQRALARGSEEPEPLLELSARTWFATRLGLLDVVQAFADEQQGEPVAIRGRLNPDVMRLFVREIARTQ